MAQGLPGGEQPPLSAILLDVLGPRPSRPGTKALVARCHRLARAYLRKRDRSSTLREDVLGEDLDDLALDAIGGLFERDENGAFSELQRSFRSCLEPIASGETVGEEAEEPSLPALIDAAEDEALHSALRRLVWSAAGDWLFETYRTADRPLSNQIRALKRAVKERPEAALTRRGGKQWVVLRTDEDASPADGRQMPFEAMEARLAGAVAEARSTGDLLARALEALRSHGAYETAYPLTRLAQAMRSARARVQSVTEHDEAARASTSVPLKREEVQSLIEETVETLREGKRDTYVGEGKVSRDTYRAYFRALRDRLAAKFVPRSDPHGPPPVDAEADPDARSADGRRPSPEGSGPAEGRLTHYEALSGHLPDLSKPDYREDHRARFEYLFQQAERLLADRLRAAVRAP
jgi:hypothetical protein